MTEAIKQHQDPFRVVIVGHVDHGKSTLIGRLLYDTDSLPEGKKEEVEEISARRGTEDVEWSFILDSFQAERDQAITIDTTQIWFSSDKRDYVIIDAPGHREFLKNMISGASSADAAILVVDAREGVQEQTRRHAYMLSLLGLKQIAVVINKMDAVDYNQAAFNDVCKQVEQCLGAMHMQARCMIPISARRGDGLTGQSPNMPWHKGQTVIGALDNFVPQSAPVDMPLRFPVQDVYRMGEQRIIAGRIESGSIKVGDEILFSPLNESAKVTAIKVWPDNPSKVKASAGEVIGITIDQRLFVERGHIGSHNEKAPMLSNVVRANIFWLGKEPLKVGNTYKIRYATHQANVTVQSIDRAINTEDLSGENSAPELAKNNVAEVTLRARRQLPIDPYTDNEQMGRVVLYDGYDIAGGGTLNMDGYPDQRASTIKHADNIFKVDHLLSQEKRVASMGQNGGVFWFTGLSGAGKSTLAMAVEQALHEKGYKTYVLDGDNVRHGLNADLGFSPKDRAENIRRIGHVAALMADAGLIVITAFISPYQADRTRAREAAPNDFHEIYVKADLQTCETRDPKGLYKKARAGEIKDFTGIDSPYEAPANPEIVIDTQNNPLETCIEQTVAYIQSCVDQAHEQTQNAQAEKDLVA